MFKNKNNEATRRNRSAKADPDEADHAYEDSWYRSLKALAESRRADQDKEITDGEAVEVEEETVQEEAVEEDSAGEGEAPTPPASRRPGHGTLRRTDSP